MIVYTQGSFDLFHEGHLNLLEKCRKFAGEDGKVVVALLTDESYTSYRGYAPIVPYEQRMRLLAACKYVDEVLPIDHQNTKAQLETVKPDLVVIGTDWVVKNIYKQYGVEKEWLDQKLVYVPYTETVSSTKIKERIKHDQV